MALPNVYGIGRLNCQVVPFTVVIILTRPLTLQPTESRDLCEIFEIYGLKWSELITDQLMRVPWVAYSGERKPHIKWY